MNIKIYLFWLTLLMTDVYIYHGKKESSAGQKQSLSRAEGRGLTRKRHTSVS